MTYTTTIATPIPESVEHTLEVTANIPIFIAAKWVLEELAPEFQIQTKNIVVVYRA